jgi:hypothetical protein
MPCNTPSIVLDSVKVTARTILHHVLHSSRAPAVHTKCTYFGKAPCLVSKGWGDRDTLLKRAQECGSSV